MRVQNFDSVRVFVEDRDRRTLGLVVKAALPVLLAIALPVAEEPDVVDHE